MKINPVFYWCCFLLVLFFSDKVLAAEFEWSPNKITTYKEATTEATLKLVLKPGESISENSANCVAAEDEGSSPINVGDINEIINKKTSGFEESFVFGSGMSGKVNCSVSGLGRSVFAGLTVGTINEKPPTDLIDEFKWNAPSFDSPATATLNWKVNPVSVEKVLLNCKSELRKEDATVSRAALGATNLEVSNSGSKSFATLEGELGWISCTLSVETLGAFSEKQEKSAIVNFEIPNVKPEDAGVPPPPEGVGSDANDPTSVPMIGVPPQRSGNVYEYDTKNPLTGVESVSQLIEKVINGIGKIIGILVVFSIVVGAMVYVTSAGNLNSMQLGKSIVTYALIGFAVVIILPRITQEVAVFIGSGGPFEFGQVRGVKEIIQAILNFLLTVVVILSSIGFVISGVMYVIATGDTQRKSLAKEYIFYCIMAVVISGGSLIILSQIMLILGAV